MDEQENKIVSLDKWKSSVAKKSSDIGAKEEEEFFEEKGETSYTGIGALLLSAYMRGNLDGKMQKWYEIRPYILTLILSNFLSVILVWWALSNQR